MEEQNNWNGNVYSQRYGVPSHTLGESFNIGNLGTDFSSNSFDLGGNLIDELLGVNAQKREFAQQEYLMDKQNEYNLPANQMARMKAAGINPNVAAGAIAQGGNESAQAPQVPSNQGGAAQGLSAVGSALGGISSIALTAAQRRNLDADSHQKNVEANRTDVLLPYEEDKFRADIAKQWIDAGWDKLQADYMAVKVAYADRQEWLDVQGKLWSISKVQQEITNLEKDYDIKVEDLKIRKEQVSQEEYRTNMMEIDAWFKGERKRIYQEVGVDPDQTEDGMLIEAYANGRSDFILNAYEEKSKRVAKGQLDAYRKQLREQLRIEWEENLKGRAKQLEQDEELQKILIKYGVKADVVRMVARDVVKYLFGTGFSVKGQGPFGIGGSVTNNPAE